MTVTNMNRDEIALQCLLTILRQADIRQSILSGERERLLGNKEWPYNPAYAYARVAWKQADEFIRAGADHDAVERGVEAVSQELLAALMDLVAAVEAEVPTFGQPLRAALDKASALIGA